MSAFQERLTHGPLPTGDSALPPCMLSILAHDWLSACSVRILGGLKVGNKKLYVYHGAQLHELTPNCV